MVVEVGKEMVFVVAELGEFFFLLKIFRILRDFVMNKIMDMRVI